jgi:hypothetical protein
MLTFLRKIRKSLIESSPVKASAKVGGSARKYLFYALGEVLLVMIGILLALQVSNWNDDRKDRKMEVRVLENMVKSLDLNINQFVIKLDRIQICDQSGEIILSTIQNKNKQSDTLFAHWHAALLNHGNLMLSNSGYESLRNVGFDIIKDEILKEEIINLYENTYLNLGRRQIWGNTVRPDWDKFILEHFVRDPVEVEKSGLVPRDYDFIVNSDYFYGLIDVAQGQRGFYKGNYEISLEETERVLELINSELESR